MRETDKPIGDPSFDHQKADEEEFWDELSAKKAIGRPERIESSISSIESNISDITEEIKFPPGHLENIDNCLKDVSFKLGRQQQILEKIETNTRFAMYACIAIAVAALKWAYG